MRLLYEIFLRLYSLGVRISSKFNPKAKKWITGRKDSFEKLKIFANEYPQNIWVHCASTGEFEQGIPLINKLKKESPENEILISFFSPSGFEYAQKKFPDWKIIYLPIDTKKNAEKWLSILQPKLVIFVKYEFWHFYFQSIKKASIPLLMVSVIFWEELFFFKWYGRFFRKSLYQVSHFFVQNQVSKDLLNRVNIKNVTVNGDTRFERILELKNTTFSNPIIEKFKGNSKVLVAGSTWDSDTKALIKIISQLPEDWKIIIAPHEPDNFSYSDFNQFSCKKYSEIQESDSGKILFLDTIGLLSKVYRFASVAYVGGGHGKGIHNLLEAAVYEIPIFCGPNIENFEEARKLQTIGILKVLNKKNINLDSIKNHFSINPEKIAANRQYFAESTNVSEQIIVFIKKQGFLD